MISAVTTCESTPRIAAARVAERREVGDVEAASVDPRGAAGHDRDLRGDPQDHRVERGPGGGRLLLGVVQPGECATLCRPDQLEIEQDRRGHQRTRQAPTPGLVRAGDETNAKLAIEAEQSASRPRSAPAACHGRRAGRVRAFRSGQVASR